MKHKDLERGRDLERSLRRLLDDDDRCGRTLLSEITATVGLWAADSSDKRFERTHRQLGRLDQHLLELQQTAQSQLREVGTLFESLIPQLRDSRLATVLTAFAAAAANEPSEVADRMLGTLLKELGAERGCVLLTDPESTESMVFASRVFTTDQLTTREYAYSFTLLGALLQQARPIRLADAATSDYAKAASVRGLRMRSVLATPLMADARRPVGALYLEDRRQPNAFSREDLDLCQQVAAVLAAWLSGSGLLQVVLSSAQKVVLDADLAGFEIIGRHSRIHQLRQRIRQLLVSPANVLIEGESGTGKELVARALHFESRRRDRPFIALSCAALPEGLLESELFGHERGAYTHAHRRRIGRLEQARGGTLFLDEIQSMEPSLQAKFLRVLETREASRLGGEQTIELEFRLVSATSCDLRREIAEGRFLEALYYRLNVVPLRVPPLRNRRSDIRLLTEHFLGRLNTTYGKAVRLAPSVHLWLAQYDWPGNVRELRNLIERLVVLARRPVVEAGDLAPEVVTADEEDLLEPRAVPLVHSLVDGCTRLHELDETLDQLRHDARWTLIERTLEQTGQNKSAAAKLLGVHRGTLHRWLEQGNTSRS